jgi:putative oxidoreductase
VNCALAKGTLGSYTHALLRIVIGFTFSLHGFQKLFGFFGGLGHGAHAHVLSLMWFAGVIETFGGLLIILGLFTRPVAFLLCGEMAVAYFKQHAGRGAWPISNGGELAVIYCFIFLYLVYAGAGPLSLDRAVRKKS